MRRRPTFGEVVRMALLRGEVTQIVTALWHEKRPGDLADIADALRAMPGFQGRHAEELKPSIRVALRWCQRKGRVRYVRRRGWVPA